METLGGIAPPTKQFLHVFAKEAAGTNTDRTVYGAASASASSFVVHHTQQISKAAVVYDAMAIRKQIISLRQRLCVNVAAQAAPAGGAQA